VLVAATLGIVLAIRDPAIEVVYLEQHRTPPTAIEKDLPPAASPSTPEHNRVARAEEFTGGTRAVDRPSTRFGNDYLSLRERVLAFGVDVLASPSRAPLPNGSPAIGDSRYGALIGQLRGG
jgi:hypothetical protein